MNSVIYIYIYCVCVCVCVFFLSQDTNKIQRNCYNFILKNSFVVYTSCMIYEYTNVQFKVMSKFYFIMNTVFFENLRTAMTEAVLATFQHQDLVEIGNNYHARSMDQIHCLSCQCTMLQEQTCLCGLESLYQSCLKRDHPLQISWQMGHYF